jgi:hypothetical protein
MSRRPTERKKTRAHRKRWLRDVAALLALRWPRAVQKLWKCCNSHTASLVMTMVHDARHVQQTHPIKNSMGFVSPTNVYNVGGHQTQGCV